MSQQQENPIHWDQHGSRFNLTLIFALAVAVLGIFTAGPIIIILGLVMAAYSWLTTPRQYLLYRDSIVIVYGIPRTRYISLAEISHVELLALPMGERLRIRMMTGSRLMLMMRDPEAFRGHLEDALARYHSEQSGAAYVEGEAVLTQRNEPDYDAEPLTEPGALPEPDSRAAGSSVNREEQTRTAAGTPAGGSESASSSSGSYTETPTVDPEEQARTDTGTPAGGSESASSSSGSYTETPTVNPEEQTRTAAGTPAGGSESASSSSGSYTETPTVDPEEHARTDTGTPVSGSESASSSSGSYTETPTVDPEEHARTAAGTPAGGGESASSSSGSYTETPEPDYSGEGRPAFGADVDIDTGRPEENLPEQPRSPPPY